MLPLPLELKAAGVLLAVAGVAGAIAWAAHQERQIGAAQCRADVTAATLKVTQIAQVESDRRAQAQAEVSNEAAHLAALARADAGRVAGVDRRLLDSASRPSCSAANPPATAGSSPAGESRWVPAELFEKSLGESRDLAARADAAFIAGQACQRAYDALTVR